MSCNYDYVLQLLIQFLVHSKNTNYLAQLGSRRLQTLHDIYVRASQTFKKNMNI